MSDPEELSISELRRRRQQGNPPPGESAPPHRPAPTQVIELDGRREPVDPLPQPAPASPAGPAWYRAVKRRWRWPLGAALIAGLAGLAVGFLTTGYSARITLVQRDTGPALGAGNQEGSFQPRQFSAATLVQLLASPELTRRACRTVRPPLSEAQLTDSITVQAAPGGELVTLALRDRDPQALVGRINGVAAEAVALTREIQRADAVQLNAFLKLKLRVTDAELEKVRAEIKKFQATERIADPQAQTEVLVRQLGEIMARIENARMEFDLAELQAANTNRGGLARQTLVLDRLQQARAKLDEKLTKYTEAHPEVISLKAEIAELERQLNSESTNARTRVVASVANAERVELQTRRNALAEAMKKQEDLRDSLQKRLTGLSQKGLQYQLLKAHQEALFRNRQLLAGRQQAVQWYQENALGYYRVLAQATPAAVSSRGRYGMAVAGLGAGLLFGLLLGIAGACLVEQRDDRIRSVEDLERVTGLPVLASVGDLGKLSDEAKDHWAFRTWTLINGKLNRTPDRGLVCGFISARDGEGKSTWIDLLVSAATKRGLRVLKITAQASADKPAGAEHKPTASAEPSVNPSEPAGTMISNALTRAADVSRQLADPRVTSVDVSLPGWVWNLDHRRQWQSALDRWKTVENVVILVELPAASLPESMLLAENVPQLIWLAAAGQASARETRVHLETLKQARCQVVGAVLNNAHGSVHNL